MARFIYNSEGLQVTILRALIRYTFSNLLYTNSLRANYSLLHSDVAAGAGRLATLQGSS